MKKTVEDYPGRVWAASFSSVALTVCCIWGILHRAEDPFLYGILTMTIIVLGFVVVVAYAHLP